MSTNNNNQVIQFEITDMMNKVGIRSLIYDGSKEQFEFVGLEDKPIIIKLSNDGPKKDFNSIRAKLQSSLIAEDEDKQFVM